jgi:hypothetical protein
MWATIKRQWAAFGLPSLLLVLVVTTHYGYALIANAYADPLVASKSWHSVLRAVESTVLYLAVWSLTPREPVGVRCATAIACIWGAAESAQIAGCRLAFPMGQPPPGVSLYTGLCDTATGLPIYMLTVSIVLLVAVLRKT